MSDVLRWVCDSYRKKLLSVSPEACREVDELMRRVGQGWICDNTVLDVEELVTTAVIQERYGISQKAIQDFARRNGIPVRKREGRTNFYRLGDILQARSK